MRKSFRIKGLPIDSCTEDTDCFKGIMDVTQHAQNEADIMERALNTENEFLKFVNNLPISNEENRFRTSGVSDVSLFYYQIVSSKLA